MIKIEVDEGIKQAEVIGIAPELIADLGIITDYIISLIVEDEDISKEKVLDRFTISVKKYWSESDKEV